MKSKEKIWHCEWACRVGKDKNSVCCDHFYYIWLLQQERTRKLMVGKLWTSIHKKKIPP